ncbi:MAG: acyl-CoA synthetase [Solirubrobacterales bacterium]|nr:acyl-CoA synthetase [Solirubrobacterales bacterium]
MPPAFPSTVGQVLARSAARSPARTALVFGERTWTYAELDAAVGRVAAQLLAAGLTKGDRVAAYGKNSDAYLALYLGCARAGLVHVPVNFNATGQELVYLLTQCEASVVFVDPSLEAQLDAVQDELGGLRRGWLLAAPAGDDVLAWMRDASGPVHVEDGVADEDLVQLLYTSGTTSRPKGAMMTHRALVHEYVSAILALELSDRDVALHSLPLYHSAQMHVFLLPALAVGAVNHLAVAPDVEAMFDHVESKGVNAVFLPPTVWVAVANHPDLETRELAGLRKAFYGASIMPVPILQRLRRALPAVGFYNCFGQSEIGPLACVLRPEEHEERPDSCGRPVLFCEVRVVDEDGTDAEQGELLYRSPQLLTGYWALEQATTEAFTDDGWFRSGDLVRIDAEGYLFVVDRIKDVINTGGVLVASREVEEALYGRPSVGEIAVIGLPHERWIEAIAAVVVARENTSVDEAELVAYAKTVLAAHKVPKSVHVVDELPKNASGKLLKRELRQALGGAGSAIGRD